MLWYKNLLEWVKNGKCSAQRELDPFYKVIEKQNFWPCFLNWYTQEGNDKW